MLRTRYDILLERVKQLEGRVDIVGGKLDTLIGMVEQLLESPGRFRSVHGGVHDEHERERGCEQTYEQEREDLGDSSSDGVHDEQQCEQKKVVPGDLSEKQREVLLSRISVREKAGELGMSIGWVSKWTNRLREDLAQSRQLDFL